MVALQREVAGRQLPFSDVCRGNPLALKSRPLVTRPSADQLRWPPEVPKARQ